MRQKRFRTRFAPSPTGFLHEGHVLHAVWLWGIAALCDAEMIVRIEDHDRQRCRKVWEDGIIRDMIWLGFFPALPCPDMSGLPRIYRQSDASANYERDLQGLLLSGNAYPCSCSRSQIRQRIEGRSAWLYDGYCLKYQADPVLPCCIRFRNRAADLCSVDGSCDEGVGRRDVALRDRNGNFTYHYCVVHDDLSQDISLIVRGEDLEPSEGEQRALARCLAPDRAYPLCYYHSILKGENGEKLSKTTGAPAVALLRERGYHPDLVRGLVMHKAGLLPAVRRITISEIPALLHPRLGAFISTVSLFSELRPSSGV
ncbi:MAG: hypothetical protein H6618_02915 [Deltaproteobacteria bacterium]|nr:hypothetical protein [Deltaproteobacteria bacterium]